MLSKPLAEQSERRCLTHSLLPVAVSLLTTGLLQPIALAQSAAPTQFARFADWCQNQKALPSATQYTLSILLAIAETSDCKQADEQLSSRTTLLLPNVEISDIRPLAPLTNLETLC